MARKNVRIDIPISSVEGSITLGESIEARHIELDVDSPLTDQIDMTTFADLLATIKDKRTPAVQDAQQKEAWNEQAYAVLGMAAGQNLQSKGTVMWYVNKVHGFMKFKFKGNEEQASLWGFNVTVSEQGGRRNVNFNIPHSSPQAMLDLSSAIIAKHNTDGAASIFPPTLIDMADFESQHNLAMQLRSDAQTKDAASQAANEEVRNLCGYGEGQNSETPDTLYWYFTRIRDYLLVVYSGNEEQLSTWGFNVVVSESSSPTSSDNGSDPDPDPGPEPVTIPIAGGETVTLVVGPQAETHLMLSLDGGELSICTVPAEEQSCDDMGFRLMDGETFEGTLTDMGLAGDAFLRARNITMDPATLTMVEE